MDATPRARVDGVPAKNIQHSAVAEIARPRRAVQ